MVKKKGKSKRTTFKDKYKIQKRVAETERKRKKQAKRDAAAGIVRHDKKKKDPGIPNSWPFKQDLLKDIQRAKDRQQQQQEQLKDKRKADLKALREHQRQGGTARTVQEMLLQAQNDQLTFATKNMDVSQEQQRQDGSVPVGQQSRRAYLRELKKVVDAADVLLQVLDARDPVGSRVHPTIEEAILSRSDKRMVLVLNKIDLVPKEVVAGWLATLRRSHPTIAIKASQDRLGGDKDDASTLATLATAAVGMEALVQLLKNYARSGAGGKTKTTIVVGIIGFPNVGKSSIINALKRTRAVGVSSRPGFTTSMQEVVLDRNVRLLDSPGVVFDDKFAMLGNCVDAYSIEDPVPAVEALLKRCDHASLLMTYNIPSFPKGDVMMFLAMVARSYGRVLKGGIPDKISAARSVLKDWNSGRIPYYTAPPAERATPEVDNDAVIVKSFGKELDLSKYDDELFKHLNSGNEMDFVKLEQEDGRQNKALLKKQELAFLSGAMDEDAMSVESMDEDVGRSELEAAEDYDFNQM